jgi:hypothetical protein
MRELERWIREMGKIGVRVILAGVRADLYSGLRDTGALAPDQIFPERRTRGSSTVEALRAAYAFVDERHPEPAGTESIRPPVTEFQV